MAIKIGNCPVLPLLPMRFTWVVLFLGCTAIAEPNQTKTTEIQHTADSVLAGGSQPVEADTLEMYKLLDNRMADLEKQIRQTKVEMEKGFDHQLQYNNSAIDSVNTSISGAAYALVIVGVIIPVVGIVLGIYVRGQATKVADIQKKSATILDNHMTIRDEVRRIDEGIKNDLSGLYNKLKAEETKHLLNRLCEVPEDIGNLLPILASRHIPKKLFPELKTAYQCVSGARAPALYEWQYRLLFFQHFPGEAIFDKDLQVTLEQNYTFLIDSSFKSNIMRTSEEFIKGTLKEGGILELSERIVTYFKALQRSRYQNDSDVHRRIYNACTTRGNRFNLYTILQKEDPTIPTAKIYGQFLLDDYKDASQNTAEQILQLKEIDEALSS